MTLTNTITALVLLLFSAPSLAHKLAPALLDISEAADGRYSVLWRTGPGSHALTPTWPAHCSPSELRIQQLDTTLEQHFELHCPGGLAGQRLQVEGLARDGGMVLLRQHEAGELRVQAVLNVDTPSFVLPERGRSEAGVANRYLLLGIEHILIGADHLLLVLGVFLLSPVWTRLLLHITAFTLGHSLTLALASLGLLRVSPDLAEIAIAATLLIMALGLARATPHKRAHGWLFAGFGLIHGLGFAGALGEIGLPQDALLTALLAFNIGIELGQVAFVLLLALGAELLRRLRASALPAARMLGIYAIGSLGWFWCLDRSWSMLA